jgi:hypothetical protein
MKDNNSIEYKVFTMAQGVLGFIVLAVMMGGICFGLAKDLEFTVASFTQNAVAIVFLLIFLVGLLFLMKMFRTGLRTVEITHSTLRLIYPHDMIEFGRSQISNLTTRRYRDDQKDKGRVRFEGSNGKKYSIAFQLAKPGGRQAFEWFCGVRQMQKHLKK